MVVPCRTKSAVQRLFSFLLLSVGQLRYRAVISRVNMLVNSAGSWLTRWLWCTCLSIAFGNRLYACWESLNTVSLFFREMSMDLDAYEGGQEDQLIWVTSCTRQNINEYTMSIVTKSYNNWRPVNTSIDSIDYFLSRVTWYESIVRNSAKIEMPVLVSALFFTKDVQHPNTGLCVSVGNSEFIAFPMCISLYAFFSSHLF